MSDVFNFEQPELVALGVLRLFPLAAFCGLTACGREFHMCEQGERRTDCPVPLAA